MPFGEPSNGTQMPVSRDSLSFWRPRNGVWVALAWRLGSLRTGIRNGPCREDPCRSGDLGVAFGGPGTAFGVTGTAFERHDGVVVALERRYGGLETAFGESGAPFGGLGTAFGGMG